MLLLVSCIRKYNIKKKQNLEKSQLIQNYFCLRPCGIYSEEDGIHDAILI